MILRLLTLWMLRRYRTQIIMKCMIVKSLGATCSKTWTSKNALLKPTCPGIMSNVQLPMIQVAWLLESHCQLLNMSNNPTILCRFWMIIQKLYLMATLTLTCWVMMETGLLRVNLFQTYHHRETCMLGTKAINISDIMKNLKRKMMIKSIFKIILLVMLKMKWTVTKTKKKKRQK